MIKGKELRDQLYSYPLGTKFKCMGHWDESTYYRVGEVYVLTDMESEGGSSFRTLLTGRGFRAHSGNGYSGNWLVVGSLLDKNLEDYL